MLVSGIYIGKRQSLEPEGQSTGIFKQLSTTAKIEELGIVGDYQADKRFHGGPEKAVHQFSVSSYAMMINEYPELENLAVPGSIGENISAENMHEKNVCIGDIYQFGNAVLQVSQPRTPCWKINHRYDVSSLSKFIHNNRITGWYYRVIESGEIKISDEISLLDRLNDAVTIDRFWEIAIQHRPSLDELDILIAAKGLADDWKKRLLSRYKFLSK